MFREWLGSVRLSSSSSLGDIGSSSSGVLGVSGVVEDRKKTGSRRRNVLKEDLVAEETKTSGEHEIGNTHTHTEYYYFYFAQFEAAILKQILENQREAQVQTLLATTLCRRAPVLGPAAVQILHNLFLVSPNYYYYYYSMAINLHFVS